MFVDETGITTALARRYGRGPTGERVHGAVPCGHSQTMTVLGALALYSVRAAMTVADATDTDVFRAFVAEFLVPQLFPGDIVILARIKTLRSKRWSSKPAHTCPTTAVLAQLQPKRVLLKQAQTLLRGLAARADNRDCVS